MSSYLIEIVETPDWAEANTLDNAYFAARTLLADVGEGSCWIRATGTDETVGYCYLKDGVFGQATLAGR
jgi:hypothetical protein